MDSERERMIDYMQPTAKIALKECKIMDSDLCLRSNVTVSSIVKLQPYPNHIRCESYNLNLLENPPLPGKKTFRTMGARS